MFDTIFVKPLLNILFFFSSVVPGHDFGVAVILITILVRIVLWPIVSKQLHSQRAITAIQPEMNKLKEKYKGDSQKLNAAVMELYKEKEVNPFSSCLTTLIQLPFLFALFAVFRKFVDPEFIKISADSGIMTQIYPFLKNTSLVTNFTNSITTLNTSMFGLLDLAAVKAPVNLFLGALAGVLQFIQSKMLMPKKQENDKASAITSQMTYLMPLMTVWFAYILPGALALYWATSTLFAVGQQYLIMNKEVETLEENKNGKKRK